MLVFFGGKRSPKQVKRRANQKTPNTKRLFRNSVDFSRLNELLSDRNTAQGVLSSKTDRSAVRRQQSGWALQNLEGPLGGAGIESVIHIRRKAHVPQHLHLLVTSFVLSYQNTSAIRCTCQIRNPFIVLLAEVYFQNVPCFTGCFWLPTGFLHSSQWPALPLSGLAHSMLLQTFNQKRSHLLPGAKTLETCLALDFSVSRHKPCL